MVTRPGEHLRAQLQRLDLLIHREILRLRAAYQLSRDEFRGLYVSDAQVDALIRKSPAADIDGAMQVALATAAEQADAAAMRLRDGNLPFARLCNDLMLTTVETNLLLLALALELDPKYATLIAYLNNDAARRAPTVQLAMRLFGGTDEENLAVRGALSPQSTLVREGLLQYVAGSPRHAVANAAFAVHPALPAFVLGLGFTDGDLPWEPVTPGAHHADHAICAALRNEIIAVASFWLRTDARRRLLVLAGADADLCAAAAHLVADETGCDLVPVDVGKLCCRAEDLDKRVRSALLGQRLTGAALHITGIERLCDGSGRLAREVANAFGMLADAPGPVVIDAPPPVQIADALPRTAFIRVGVAALETAHRRALWQQALDEAGLSASSAAVQQIAEFFALSVAQTGEAVRSLALRSANRGGAPLGVDELSRAARDAADRSISSVAQRLNLEFDWDDLVLPPAIATRLREVANAIAQRCRVYGDWGFRRRAGGYGIRTLLWGPSGTGKTLAVAVIGRVLGLDVYRIDIAQTVSKYIGETEKNLDRVFAASAASNAILFFDEADALFGKRSEVKDAHDRYGNIETAYLLQKIEEHPGIVFLATNLSRNIDTAFARRMTFVVEFPMPDEAARGRLWRAMFPCEAPLAADVDFDFLAAQFPLAGGDIRNVALDAAFLAAQDGQVICMSNVVRALARQVDKQGRVASIAEFREYHALLEGAGK